MGTLSGRGFGSGCAGSSKDWRPGCYLGRKVVDGVGWWGAQGSGQGDQVP